MTIGQKPKSQVASYSPTNDDRPIAEVKNDFFDFGEIKVSDIKQKDFALTNSGNKPLQILNITSSCNCTFGQIIYDNGESKRFGMHAQSGYVTEVAPGAKVMVRVIYQPSLMPVYGLVEREVYLTTNDPNKERLVFSVKANVK